MKLLCCGECRLVKTVESFFNFIHNTERSCVNVFGFREQSCHTPFDVSERFCELLDELEQFCCFLANSFKSEFFPRFVKFFINCRFILQYNEY